MKFPKLYKVVSKDGFRESLAYAWVNKSNTFASDSHIMVVHSTPEIFGKEFTDSLPDEGIIIPYTALFAICRTSTFSLSYSKETGTLTLLSDRSRKKYLEHDIKPDLVFPLLSTDKVKSIDFLSVIPNVSEAKPLEKIAINGKLIANLQEAMCQNLIGIKLYFFEEHKGILCFPGAGGDYPSAKGMIMPCAI